MKSRCSVCGYFACICEWESRKKDALLDLENAKSATPNPSPGPTTTPVEKREEDVATDARCKFDIAWVGPCGEPSIGHGFCQKHHGMMCAGCGRQAIRECDTSMGLTCGFPLCADCEHTRDHKHKPKAEPQPISNPLVCGRRQEAARELIQSWRTSASDCRQLAIDYPKTGAIAVQRASVYLQCADNLEAALDAALLEGKS